MDDSDSVAAEVLVRDAPESGGVLAFHARVRWHVVLGLGSWGVVIVVPMIILLASGELPTVRQVAAVGPILLIGLALWYFAARTSVNGAWLSIEGRELRFRRGPLWPFRRRSFSLDAIAGTHVEIHPDSFRFPARWRTYRMPRPYQVHLVLRAGGRAVLPLALGARDAHDVAAWIARHAR